MSLGKETDDFDLHLSTAIKEILSEVAIMKLAVCHAKPLLTAICVQLLENSVCFPYCVLRVVPCGKTSTMIVATL